MQIILTKKQIQVLREDDGKTGLNVMMSPSGNTANGVLNTIKSLPDGVIDKATIPTPNAAKNPQNTNIKVELETNDGDDVSPTDIKKLATMGNQIGASGEIDFKNENVIKYSKKELTEILFR